MGVASPRQLMSRHFARAGLALFFLLSGPWPSETRAQVSDDETSAEEEVTKEAAEEDEQKLSDRIKSVQQKVFLKRRRFDVTPFVGLNLNDAFFRQLTLGGSLAYHITDGLALEARGVGVVVQEETDVVRFVREETDALLTEQYELDYLVDFDLLWAPIYGKMSLFGDAILHFDTYIAAGGGLVGTDVGLHGAGNLGIGMRFFALKWLAVRIEYRNYFFVEERNGDSELRTPGFFGLMVSFFLPPKFEYDYE